MSSPDFRTFVDGIVNDHRAWLSAHPNPGGAEFLDHYVGSAAQPAGLLWRFEAWRAEHGFVRLRPWDGSEDLGRPASASIPSPGQVLPWNAPGGAGPAIDSRLGSGQTTAHHHVYWRLDFDIETASENQIREFNDPPIIPGTNWHTKSYEIMRLRSTSHNRRWRVENTSSGAGYDIVPGANDGTAAGDNYARGDLWFLRYHAGEIDDHPIIGTEIQIDRFKNGEPLIAHDVVVWYGAHFTHDISGPPVDHIVGPDLHPHHW